MSSTVIENEDNNRLAHFRNYLKMTINYSLASIIYLAFAVIVAIVYTGSVRFPSYTKSSNVSLVKAPDFKVEDHDLKHATVISYPFIGALTRNKSYTFLCTAVIINDRHLIADAKCFSDIIDIQVRVGSDFWNDSGSTYSIETFSIIINVPYTYRIALIVLNETIEFGPLIQPVHINWAPSIVDGKGVIAGWLPFQHSLCDSSSRMVELEMSIWNENCCKMYMNDTNFICGTINNGTCNVVPTGPLLLEGSIIGIWYNESPCAQNPLIFRNLNYLEKWFDNLGIKYSLN